MTVGTIQSDKFQLGYKVIGSGAAAIIVGSNLYYSRTFSTDLAKRFAYTLSIIEPMLRQANPFKRMISP